MKIKIGKWTITFNWVTKLLSNTNNKFGVYKKTMYEIYRRNGFR